jgi:hypothetical protein
VSAPSPGEAIEAALREVAARLEANDPSAAAVAVAGLGAACEAAARVGLDDVTRTRLQPMVDRCLALAARTNAKLAATLGRLGTGNRAHRAYNAE